MASYWRAGMKEGYEDYHSAKCDGCGEQDFQGDRFDCNACDAIFCESCMLAEDYGSKSDAHTEFHSCKVTPCPLDRHCSPQQSETCRGCLSEKFCGVGYKCKECQDYVLCQSCHHTGCYAPLANTSVAHTEKHEVEEIQPVANDSLAFSRMLASATKFQQMMGPTQVSWHTYHASNCGEWISLGRKLGYALYSAPTINAEESDVSMFGYSKEQEQRICELRSHMLGLNKQHGGGDEVAVAFIFISYFEPEKFENALPLFKVFTKGPTYFVEPSKRHYKGWSDFRQNNCLPPCWMICPYNGTYILNFDDRICIEQLRSASCKSDRKTVEVVDRVATGGALVGTALAVVGLFTPLAPVAAGALLTTGVTTGAWFTGRATAQLVDRGTHGQNINPFSDREAFFSWLSIVSTVASVGSSFAVSRLAEVAREGVAIGAGTRFLANVAIFGSLGINGFGCISSLVTLVDDLNKGQKPSTLQLFQLSAQLLFFANAVYSVQQARVIIENATKSELASMRNQMSTKEERTHAKRVQKRNNQRFGPEVGKQVTLKHLKDLQMQQKPVGDIKLGTAAQRHAHFDKEHMSQNGQPRNMEESAAALAEGARTTRYGGRQADSRSKTTILAVDPDALQHKINEAMQPSQQNGRHDVKVPGTYQGWEFRYDPVTGETVKVYVQVKDPVFGVTNGRANHFNAQQTGSMSEIPRQQFYDAYQPVERVTPISHRFFPPRPARGDRDHDE